MTVYWVMVVLAVGFMALGQFIVTQGKHKKNQVLEAASSGEHYLTFSVVLSAFVYIFVTGFRYGVGRDYFYTYVPYFNNVYYSGKQGRMELGFYAINYLVSRVTSNPTPVFVICSIIFFACIYASILKYSPKPTLSVFLITGMAFVFVFMNTMRQMVAISILLYGVRFIEDRKPLQFALIVTIASSFHSSAVVFLVAYLFTLVKLNAVVAVLTAGALFLSRTLIAQIMLFIVKMSSYSDYIGSQFDTGNSGNVVMAMNIMVFLFAALVPGLEGKKYSSRYNLFLLFQLAAMTMSFLSGTVVLSQRIKWLFSLPAIILLPMTLHELRDARIRLITETTVTVLYVIYIYTTIGKWNGNSVLPYESYFSIGIK